MLTPSDIVVRPTNLTDRLAAQGSGGMPANPEPTQRFGRGANAA